MGDDQPVFRRAANLEPALLPAAVVAAWFVYRGTMLNHDSSWYLVATAAWLDGAVLYRDILENNPPLAFYLTAPAMLLSRATGLTGENAFLLTCFAAIAGALIWARRLLGMAPSVTPFRRAMLLAGSFAALCLTPINDFGQRDHLTVIFVLPYVILAANGPEAGRIERGAIGLVASIGIALKPHFVLLPIILVLPMAARRGGLAQVFAAQHLVIPVAGAFYAIFIALAHPEYLEVVLPWARLGYGSYDVPWPRVILVAGFALFPMLAAITAAKNFGLWERSAATTFLAAAFAFIAAYLLQYKGWDYHTIPIYSYLLIAASWILTSPALWRSRAWRAKILVALALPTAVAVFGARIAKGPYYNGHATLYAPYLMVHDQPRSFVALDTRVAVSFPMANMTDATVASRFPALWLIPGAVRQLALDAPDADRRRRLEEMLEFTRRTIAGDFAACRPDVVLVDIQRGKPYFGGIEFDYLEFLGGDERFRSAWRDYQRVARVAGIEIWQRSAQPAPHAGALPRERAQASLCNSDRPGG